MKNRLMAKPPTSNDTTGAIIKYLNMVGFHVWRNNTHGLWDSSKQCYRKLQYQQKGVADIIGFRRSTGQFISVEVKTGRDELSIEQQHFLETVRNSGGIGMVVTSFDDFYKKFEQRQNNQQNERGNF